MQGRICLVLATLFLTILAGCSGNSLMKPDCHSCTTEEQEWKDFSWKDLSGQWKGFVESSRNDRAAAKKVKNEKNVEFRFLTAADFLRGKNVACEKLPLNAVVMNGQLWEQGAASKRAEYETFMPIDDDKVAYGRLSFEKMNGREICQFRRLGRVMGTNRLALPTVSFSEYSTVPGRSLASMTGDAEVSVEFLRFAPAAAKKPVAFGKGRGPASVKEQERPPLMIRVYKISSLSAGERGQWSGSEEQIYRLWKAE